jgi:TRAP-type C4-dicarboxylate transport system permease large subunit
MDGMALLLLSIPIFFPVTQSLGYDPIWFGIIVVVVMEIAVITPPIGLNVFVVKGIAKDVPIGTIFRGVFPFFLADLVLLVILMLVPQLALLLPKLLTY